MLDQEVGIEGGVGSPENSKEVGRVRFQDDTILPRRWFKAPPCSRLGHSLAASRFQDMVNDQDSRVGFHPPPDDISDALRIMTVDPGLRKPFKCHHIGEMVQLRQLLCDSVLELLVTYSGRLF